jgi:hypothetical protein
MRSSDAWECHPCSVAENAAGHYHLQTRQKYMGNISGSHTGSFIIVIAGRRRVLGVESGIWIIKCVGIRNSALVERAVGILAVMARIIVNKRRHEGTEVGGLLCERDRVFFRVISLSGRDNRGKLMT